MSKIASMKNKMPNPEVNLSDLFGENTMKMQSSMVYKALRGEGMRVMPLVGSKGNFLFADSEKLVIPKRKVCSQISSNILVGKDARASKSKVVRNSFDLREAACEGPSKKRRMEDGSVLSKPEVPDSGAVVMEFKKREATTALSENSRQRVPFRSTKLERPMSRASLQEDDQDRKQKVKKSGGQRIWAKKALPPRIVPKAHMVLARGRISSNIPQVGSKRRRTENKNRLVEQNKEDAPAGKAQPPDNMKKDSPKTAPKEENKKNETLEKREVKIHPASAPPSRGKARGKPRGSIINVAIARPKKPLPNSSKKTLWIPTSESTQSWNQFSSDATRRIPAQKSVKFPRRVKKATSLLPVKKESDKKKIEEMEVAEKSLESASESSGADPSDTEDEDTRLRSEWEMRRHMEQKSIDFFNQFKYGEVLKKCMPRVRYNSEVQVDTRTKQRLSDVEVRMRLSRLEESESKISELVPRWSALLLSMKQQDVVEGIQKTLTNANHILEKKVNDAKRMLTNYKNMCDSDSYLPPTEEMMYIEHHSSLVQLDMDSLERLFDHHEKQLKKDLDEPSSVSP